MDVPVIGLPTSTGYGLGGRGEAALLGMLQSCSPGLVVVNIDNGIGAGRHGGAHRPRPRRVKSDPASSCAITASSCGGTGRTRSAERSTRDYQDLLSSPLGERILRTLIDDLIACTEAEDYEVPGLMRASRSA